MSRPARLPCGLMVARRHCRCARMSASISPGGGSSTSPASTEASHSPCSAVVSTLLALVTCVSDDERGGMHTVAVAGNWGIPPLAPTP